MSGSASRSFASRVQRNGDDSFALELVSGENNGGQPCWWLLLLPQEKVETLRRSLKTRDTDLTDFGEIMASGEGTEPPETLAGEIVGLLSPI